MLLYNVSVILFAILCILLILLILVQKGKSSMGLGSLGGGTQLLFGGSGGQDLFQKMTWALGTIFMVGSLLLAMIKRPTTSDLLGTLAQAQQQQQVPVVPTVPVQKPAEPASATPAAPQQ